MAKKKVKEEGVNCSFGGSVENFLIDCSNKEANPGGYKKGTWEHICKHYKEKETWE
ncbi:MAG: hypothetical protein LBQ22_05630 [Bacteroidales bacterium]|jgi:hypothetical protein|nr:hypothetical protein [Bacteroidales bacterium]